MSFPRYPKYKDSGVEWLGPVPEHWDVHRLKRFCHAFPSNVDKKSYDGETQVRLCNYTDVYYNDEISDRMELMQATASQEQIEKFTLRVGDTIITKDSETADDIAKSAYVPVNLPGVVCGYHLAIIRPLNGTIGRFVKRLFDSSYAAASFAVRANGLTRVGLGQHELENVDFPLPPPEEQTAIASFLDRETVKIDALIAEQQRLIELLKEKRQAVISHAVTKGLNPNAPMKPSGIEWLGDVPDDWELKRAKFVVSQVDGIQMGPFGGMLLDLEIDDTGFKVYGQENTISGDFTLGNRWLKETRFAELASYQIRSGDLLLTRKGSLGNARMVGELPQPGIADSDTIRLRVNERIIAPRFLAMLFHEAAYIAIQIDLTKRGAILSGLNSETVANIALILPPLEIQQQLLDYLEGELSNFDALTAESQRAVNVLQERRTALISAAVTGQIDVRGCHQRPA